MQDLDAFGLYHMTFAYLVLGDTEKALSIASESIRRYPTDARVYLGMALVFLGKPKDAIKQLTTAIRYATGSTLVSTLTNRSANYLDVGDWKAALSDTEIGLQLLGNDTKTAARIIPALLNNHCSALMHLDKTEAASQTLREALPLYTDALARAVAFGILGDKQQMLKT